jgi:hypothetical protein
MNAQITRRQLLKSGGGVVLASFALPRSLRTLLDTAPTATAGALAAAWMRCPQGRWICS